MIILYVSLQDRSTTFYECILGKNPILNVEGMTEFQLSSDFLLGLMPESGITNIICPMMPLPSSANGIPRCELYLWVDDPAKMLELAVRSGATHISNAKTRDWGDVVSYCADPDVHIIAFAKQ